MAKALKCDRCGAFYDYIKCLRRYQIHDMGEKNFNKTVDLCPDCYAKLLLFLDLDNDNGSVGSGELYPGEFESTHYEFEEDSDGSSST